MTYAKFPERMFAAAIDILIFLPFIFLVSWAQSESSILAIGAFALDTLLALAYIVVAHAKWGRTIGKRLTHLRVQSVDGGPVGWRRSFQRNSVVIVLSGASVIAYAVVMSRIPQGHFARGDWWDIQRSYDSLSPLWVNALDYAYLAWFGGDIITMVASRQGRTIHDFIGGTVVVSEAPPDAVPVGFGALRGSVRMLAVFDLIGIGVAFASALSFSLLALSSRDTDRDVYAGAYYLMCYGAIVATLFTLAYRALVRGHPRHRILRVTAAVLLFLPFIALAKWSANR